MERLIGWDTLTEWDEQYELSMEELVAMIAPTTWGHTPCPEGLTVREALVRYVTNAAFYSYGSGYGDVTEHAAFGEFIEIDDRIEIETEWTENGLLVIYSEDVSDEVHEHVVGIVASMIDMELEFFLSDIFGGWDWTERLGEKAA